MIGGALGGGSRPHRAGQMVVIGVFAAAFGAASLAVTMRLFLHRRDTQHVNVRILSSILLAGLCLPPLLLGLTFIALGAIGAPRAGPMVGTGIAAVLLGAASLAVSTRLFLDRRK